MVCIQHYVALSTVFRRIHTTMEGNMWLERKNDQLRNLNQQGRKKLAVKYTKVTEKLTKKVTTRTDKIIENACKKMIDSEKDDEIEKDGGISYEIKFSGETSCKKARFEGIKLVSSVGFFSLPEFEIETKLLAEVEPEVHPG